MSDGNTDRGDRAPDSDEGDEPLYRGQEGAEEEPDVETETAPESEGLFARVPESVISLGAGSLATSALLTLAATVFTAYSVYTGQWHGFQPHKLVMATILYAFSALFQSTGVYFARQRTRWLWVMLATLMGVLSFVGIPFAALAFICLGLGKYHFASYTPSKYVTGSADS